MAAAAATGPHRPIPSRSRACSALGRLMVRAPCRHGSEPVPGPGPAQSRQRTRQPVLAPAFGGSGSKRARPARAARGAGRRVRRKQAVLAGRAGRDEGAYSCAQSNPVKTFAFSSEPAVISLSSSQAAPIGPRIPGSIVRLASSCAVPALCRHAEVL